jgi:prepilin-type N-terminal cleavage/methylation domain-containing protein/prepilin-type processing-associated H-X9-DG protein
MARSRRRRGFTLIELLVVIAIIAILAAILFPVFAQAREQARKAACLSNEKQIALAIAMYRQDWDSHGPFAGWPPGSGAQYIYSQEWQFTIQPYIKNAQVLRCPSDRSPYLERPVSYLYNNMVAFNRHPLSEAELDAPAEVVTLWDGYGSKDSATQKDRPPVGGVVFPDNYYREYTQWGNKAQWLADDKYGLPRHSGGGNVIYMDLHAKWVRYGEGAAANERLQSVKNAFPFRKALDPRGVGASGGFKDWIW